MPRILFALAFFVAAVMPPMPAAGANIDVACIYDATTLRVIWVTDNLDHVFSDKEKGLVPTENGILLKTAILKCDEAILEDAKLGKPIKEKDAALVDGEDWTVDESESPKKIKLKGT